MRIWRHAVVVSLLGAGALFASSPRGIVRSGGQSIPGATVTAKQNGKVVLTTTDESGRYVFDALPPGHWVMEVGMFGFSTARREVDIDGQGPELEWNLELRSATPVASGGPSARGRPDFRTLGLTQTAESEINAALEAPAPPVNHETPSDSNEAFLVSGSLSRGLSIAREENLFEQRRGEMMDRAQMGPSAGGMPGFPGLGQEQGTFGGPGLGGFGGRGGPGGPGGPGMMGRGGGPGMMPGGGRGPQGGPGDRFPRGGPGEFVFGNRRNPGRAGFRGNVFFSLRNSALDARPFSLTGQTVEKPSYASSRFGIAGGGPLRIPKLVTSSSTFIFVNYFGTRSRSPYNATATVPSLSARDGDFSVLPTGATITIYDPGTGVPFAGNKIPAYRINRAALGLLDFIPLPNQPGAVQNYQYVTSVPQNSDQFSARVMQNLSRKDRLAGSLNLQRRHSESSQLFGFRDEGSGLGLSSDLRWTHNFTSRLINTFHLSFSRNRTETDPYFSYRDNVAARLGILGTSQDPVNYGPPNLTFTNFGGLSDSSPSLRRDQTAGASNGLILVRGSHTLSVGGEYRRSQLNQRTDQNARGSFTFTGLATSALDGRGQPVAGTGFDFADFLLGLPQSSSVRFGSANTYFRGSVYNAYVQDDWRARANLSLNFGLRYEYFTPLREKFGRMANLDVAPDFTGVAVVVPGGTGPYSGAFPDGLVDPDKNTFSPRIGIAWRPFPKHRTQIRTGYGMFFNSSVYNQFASRLASQPPFAQTATLNTSAERPLTIENGFAVSPSTKVTNTYAVDRHYRLPYAQTWNFAVQQELPHALVLELGYLGTKGTRLDIQRLPNRAAPGSPLTAEQRRQIGNAVGFTFDSSEGNSIYHAAQARITRRFRRGLSANALYTWSKSIDNASTFGGGGATVAQNDKDLSAERGLSTFDRRNTLSLFYVLSSPAGSSASRFGGGKFLVKLLQDWTMSGGLTANSGAPLTASVLGNLSDSGGTGSIGSGRADATGEGVDAGGRFFNTAAFTLPPAGRLGNAGRNTIPGPGLFAVNLSVGRSFALGGERRRLELRAESTNTINHTSFTNVGTVVNAAEYGLPTATAPMRTVSLTARYRF